MATEPRAEQGRSSGPGSRAGGSLAHGSFRRGCVLLRPPHRTEGGRGGAGGAQASRVRPGTAPRCVWAEASGARARPAGVLPLGPLDSERGEGSPVLTPLCSAAVLRAPQWSVSYGNLREERLVSFP